MQGIDFWEQTGFRSGEVKTGCLVLLREYRSEEDISMVSAQPIWKNQEILSTTSNTASSLVAGSPMDLALKTLRSQYSATASMTSRSRPLLEKQHYGSQKQLVVRGEVRGTHLKKRKIGRWSKSATSGYDAEVEAGCCHITSGFYLYQ